MAAKATNFEVVKVYMLLCKSQKEHAYPRTNMGEQHGFPKTVPERLMLHELRLPQNGQNNKKGLKSYFWCVNKNKKEGLGPLLWL